MSDPQSTQDDAENLRSKLEQIVETKAYVNDLEMVPWYTRELEEPKPTVRDLFESYSKVPSADVVAHIKHVRNEAFKIYPYPCLGNWGFLNFSVGEGPAYQEVLARIKSGEQYLDLGCCMGQDLRKLVHDGAPSENTFASDLKKDFWDFGYEMFLDKSTLQTRFVQADIFDAESQLKELDGKIDIVNAASFFHLFGRDDQVKAAKRVVQLLKPEAGSLIVGRQGGRADAGGVVYEGKMMTAFWHNPDTWAELWKQVGQETGTEWKVEATLGAEDLTKRMKTNLVPSGTRFMTFSIRRL